MSNKKPLIIAMEEAEQTLVSTVNAVLKSGVPCYFLERIFDKIHRQITDGAKQELAQTSRQYAQDIERAKAEAEKEILPVEEITEKEGDVNE